MKVQATIAVAMALVLASSATGKVCGGRGSNKFKIQENAITRETIVSFAVYCSNLLTGRAWGLEGSNAGGHHQLVLVLIRKGASLADSVTCRFGNEVWTPAIGSVGGRNLNWLTLGKKRTYIDLGEVSMQLLQKIADAKDPTCRVTSGGMSEDFMASAMSKPILRYIEYFKKVAKREGREAGQPHDTGD